MIQKEIKMISPQSTTRLMGTLGDLLGVPSDGDAGDAGDAGDGELWSLRYSPVASLVLTYVQQLFIGGGFYNGLMSGFRFWTIGFRISFMVAFR